MKIGLKHIFFTLTVCALMISCAKEYSSEIAIPPNGNWQFSQGNVQYAGYLQSVYMTNGGNSNQLMLSGKSNDGSQIFQLVVYADTITIGSYKASEFHSALFYGTSQKPIYKAGEQYGEFIVNVTKLDSTSITGNFSGTVQDSSYSSVQIIAGKFQVQ